MKDKVEIGKIIQEARKKKGYTQIQLAEKLNVSNKAISHWEKGRYYPDYEYFNDIAKVLDIDLNEYLIKEEKKIIKHLKVIINAVFIITFIFLFTYFINTYNKFTLYKVSLDSKDIILNNSYITKTKEYMIINLGELENLEYLIQPTYKITLYYKDNKLIVLNNYTNLTFTITDKNIIKNEKDLSINVEYNYFDREQVNQRIKLNLTKLETYHKKNKVINESQENLLLNNGYYILDNNKYVKQIKDTKYKYNTKSHSLTYEDNTTMASYNGEEFKYIVVLNGKIVEEYINANEKRTQSYDKIFSKIYNEYQRIKLNNN